MDSVNCCNCNFGFTNPSKEEHINEIVQLLTQDAFEEMSSEGDAYGILGASMG